MRSSTPRILAGVLAATAALFAVPACNDSAGYRAPGVRPLLTKAALTGNITTVNCAPKLTGGACPISVDLYFRLPEEQFVTGAFVRFQHDGSDRGVDHFFPLKEDRYGAGVNKDVGVSIDTSVPATLVGTGTLFTFSVRLLTGVGEESDESTLTITVTGFDDTTPGTGGKADAGS